jgi:hypothetical protein
MPPEPTQESTPITSSTPVPKKLLSREQLLMGLVTLSLVGNIALALLYSLELKNDAPLQEMPELPAVYIPEETLFEEEAGVIQEMPGSNTVTVSRELTPDPRDYSMYYKNIITQAGVTWLAAPVSLGDLQLLESVDGLFQFTYYQIGSRDNEQIVFVQTPCEGMCEADHLVLIVDANNKATVLKKNSSSDVDPESEWSVVRLAPGVLVDSEYQLDALLPEEKITASNTLPTIIRFNWSQSIQSISIFSESYFNANQDNSPFRNVEFITDTDWGPLFSSYSASEVGTADYIYAIRLPGGLYAAYDEAKLDFVTDDRVPQITWTDGGKNTDPYRGDRLTGCGGGGPEVLLEQLTAPAIELVGTTITGDKVYNVVNENNPLIQRVFEMTDGTVYEYDTTTGLSKTTKITPAEFITKKGVLIVENLGRQLVFTNSKYGPQAECGKPVIYLYPEATTTISVKVDALITKSEPVYDNGWTATAYPNGTLQVGNGTYTSLFWDGYGNGTYPVIKEGFVVRTEDFIATASKHLRFIGFTEFEISEFAKFWSDHLPAERYTRFSWLQTVEMERLAKLTISPKPDTLIRAFIDYEGIAKPVKLEPQKLIPRKRNGYVATEWGGLLRK